MLFHLKVAFDEKSKLFFEQLQTIINNEFPEIETIGYCESSSKERNKAFRLKGGYSARKTPFAVITNEEDKPLKAFYSEVSECTLDHICNYIKVNRI